MRVYLVFDCTHLIQVFNEFGFWSTIILILLPQLPHLVRCIIKYTTTMKVNAKKITQAPQILVTSCEQNPQNCQHGLHNAQIIQSSFFQNHFRLM